MLLLVVCWLVKLVVHVETSAIVRVGLAVGDIIKRSHVTIWVWNEQRADDIDTTYNKNTTPRNIEIIQSAGSQQSITKKNT